MDFVNVTAAVAPRRLDVDTPDTLSLFDDFTDDERRDASLRLAEIEKVVTTGFEDERPEWLDGRTPPKTDVPNANEYDRALAQFGAKDSEEFRQKYLEGFTDEDLKWIVPDKAPEAEKKATPTKKTPRRPTKKTQTKKAPIQGIPVTATMVSGPQVTRQQAAAQRVSNKRGMDQLWYPVPITGEDRRSLAALSKKEDPRFETLDLAIRKSGLGYSDEAIKTVLANTNDENSLNGSRERVTDGLQSKGPYTIFLSNGIRRSLYRADLERAGKTSELSRFDFDARVEDETAKIEAEFAKIEPQNNLHAAVLALAKENALKRAIDKIAADPTIDVRDPSEQQGTINSVADGIQSALTSMMDSNPALQFLPDEVKQQIADYGVGLARGGVQLAGTVKGARDFVQDTATDLLLSAVETSGLDKQFGVDTKKVRQTLETSRKEDAQLWRDLSNAQTARISRGELGYEKKLELGLRTTPYDVPNWAVRAGEVTTKALPYLVVGAATGGASLPAQIAINGALGGITAGGEVYNQTRDQSEAVKAAAYGVAQGAVMPLTNRLGYSGDLAASTALDYVTQKIRNPNASDNELIQSMVTQAFTSGALHTGSRLYRALQTKTGFKLTPETAKTAYQKMLETDLPAISEEVAVSSRKQTERIVDSLAPIPKPDTPLPKSKTKSTPTNELTNVAKRAGVDPVVFKDAATNPKSTARLIEQMRAEMTPEQLAALDTELMGRRLVDQEHFEAARAAGDPNPELKYGRVDFEGWKRAEKIMMDAADNNQPLTVAMLQKAQAELSGGFLPEAKRGLLRTDPRQSAFQGGEGGGPVRQVSAAELEGLRNNPDLQIAEIGKIGDKYGVIVEYTSPTKVRAKLDRALQRIEQRLAAGEDPVTVAADAQREIVSIHPFEDGNGRTSRLVMDYVLRRARLPPSIVENTRLDTGSTPEQWRQEVRKGLQRPLEVTRDAWQRSNRR